MDEQSNDAEEEREVRRPRVVDKRVSARTETPSSPRAPEAPPAEPSAPPSAPSPSPPPQPADPAPPEAAADPDLWTPEQEAEAMRVVEEIARVPAGDWIADSAIRLANVAGVKLDRGSLGEAQLAIDALAGLIEQVGGRLGEAEAPLRQTLAQLQLAFAQTAAGPSQAP
jgi:hypothetical protein